MKNNDIIFYTDPKGNVKIEVNFLEDTFWLSQKKISELFDVEVNTVNYHLKEIFRTQELKEEAVIRKIRITAEDGKNYLTNIYSLDVIIAVGYRVNSYKATQFRIWATNVLKEFILKGFILDDQRLKQGSSVFGKDYFDELLERIREIRASERRFYQKITDIYAQCSVDYDAKSETTLIFYKTVQNKLHWAITGSTAAEIISNRANSVKPNMGLTNWKHSPKGKILKSDISIAKNYLNESEISELNRIVGMYLDYAENQAKKQNPMSMVDWISKLDGFLKFNEYNVLKNSGKISHDIAIQLAEVEFEKYRVFQDKNYISDFDNEIKKLSPPNKTKRKNKKDDNIK